MAGHKEGSVEYESPVARAGLTLFLGVGGEVIQVQFAWRNFQMNPAVRINRDVGDTSADIGKRPDTAETASVLPGDFDGSSGVHVDGHSVRVTQ